MIVDFIYNVVNLKFQNLKSVPSVNDIESYFTSITMLRSLISSIERSGVFFDGTNSDSLIFQSVL